MNLYRGEGNLPDLAMFPTASGQLPFPLKFGYHEIGEVRAAGEGTSLSRGDRVLCFHPHQSVFTLSEQFASKIPADLAPERAAFGALFGVALNACMTTPPVIGDCVAVSGLGVVGTLTAALARRTATRLVLVEPSEERRRRAEWIRADAIVDPADAADAIADLTDGRGVDLYFEASGAPPALQAAIRTTAMEGTVTVPAWYGTRPVTLSLSPEFHLRRLKLISTGPFPAPQFAPRWNQDRLREVAWQQLEELDVDRTLITHWVPFASAPNAYKLLDDPSAETLAVLLQH
jgi:threonine dehydrogenase-like Zn-dependent dehydrogenase